MNEAIKRHKQEREDNIDARHSDSVIIERLDNLILQNDKDHCSINKDMKEKLDLILLQTTKTNGSVAAIKKWKSRMEGGIAIISLILVPLFLWLVYSHMK